MAPMSQRVRFGDRELIVSHLDKILFPVTDTTKADVIDYYVRVAAVLLPHITGRILTRVRYPHGTGDVRFFEKHAPPGLPEWLRTAAVPSKTHAEGITYVVADEPAALVWLANLYTIELHTPQWRLDDTDDDGTRRPDRLVIDLDPGEGAGIAECVHIAHLVRERLESDGLTAYPKTSGKNGIHLVAPISGTQPAADVTGYAKALARELAAAHPRNVTATMGPRNRVGKVLIDWSQNNPAKTTVAAYSLRGQPAPVVSTPITWSELDGEDVGPFDPAAVLERVADLGDLHADVTTPGPPLPIAA